MQKQDKKELVDIWGIYAKAYITLMPHVSFYNAVRSRVLQDLWDQNTIADVGCGPGIFASDLVKKGKTVYAIDNSQEMLCELLGNVRRGEGFVYAAYGELSSLPMEYASCNAAIALNSLYTCPDIVLPIRELYRITDEQGKVVITGPVQNVDSQGLYQQVVADFITAGLYEKSSDLIDVFFSCNRQIEESCMHTKCSVDELVDIVQSVGFSKVIRADHDIYQGQAYYLVAQKGG